MEDKPSQWNMGMLNADTIEVPGSVLLLAKDHNEPLGLRHVSARSSQSSLPTGLPPRLPVEPEKKKTPNGQIILEPQPDDSHNDPLNWASWRRDLALLSLGLYCMVGGGTTPLLAAGFSNVASDYHIKVSEVSLTTGIYMMGLGIGCVIFAPTAILYGKRPVYLFGAVLFIVSAVWCALSPNYTSLILARIFQGIAVSPVECLPSATIAEIFFLHERAFRIGIYTLLLLGGKNLVPLVSAVIIQSLSWRWVFWILAMVVGFAGTLVYFLVPETFWDRTPLPHNHAKRPSFFRRLSSARGTVSGHAPQNAEASNLPTTSPTIQKPVQATKRAKNAHVGFAPDLEAQTRMGQEDVPRTLRHSTASSRRQSLAEIGNQSMAGGPEADCGKKSQNPNTQPERPQETVSGPLDHAAASESEKFSLSIAIPATAAQAYTHTLRESPPKSYVQQLQVYHGRLCEDLWWKVATRPFILFAYPAVLWSSLVYSCSIGWLIVISESVTIIYRESVYEFSALSTGLVYLSPFIGGILGSGVAGKVSDLIVKAMARRNGGLYEPEFRLIMAIPIALTTGIGLMGFGWSAANHDAWIVPTLFFGIVSFGCSLGSTTAITFCVDSYRQYAGEALVTLNFSKNIFHGLVFSLFVTNWLTVDGSKSVFVWIGVIQMIALISTIPMYIYGKRARMWTVRKNLMENF